MAVPGIIRRIYRRLFRDPKIAALPSRQWLLQELLPALKAAGHKRMLFVGTQAYNRPFYRECHGLKVFSIDPDPANARYGAPDGHHVGFVQDIARLAPGATFDVIVFNGIIGFGVNDVPSALDALKAMAGAATPETLLMIGWNPGRTDGQEIAALRPRLIPTPFGPLAQATEFPALGKAQRNPHVYEFFRFGPV
jgi:hypothetical protein